jgi:putative ABC transport system permease protein
VPTLLGRTFQGSDQAQGCTIVLSHEFWRSVNGDQENLIGKPLRLDDQDCEVIGVMPPGFVVYPNPASMIWTLMPVPQRPDQFGAFAIGRLKPGVSKAQAQNELVMLHYRLHANDRWGELMEPRVYELQSEFTWLTSHNLKLSLIVLFCAVSIVLLICCANVSNLLLGRSVARRREMAIRASLGSGWTRLLRQLLTENLLLSGAATVIGVAIAWGAVHYFRITNPVELPPAAVVRMDSRILVFTILLSAVTTLVFGLVPAWKASRTDLNTVLKTSGRSTSEDAGSQRFSGFLIIAEVALTLLLLTGAGLLIQSVNQFAAAPLGFKSDGLFTARIELPKSGYTTPEQRARFYGYFLDQLLAKHEIQEVALSTALPTAGTGSIATVAVEGQPDPRPGELVDTGTNTISPDYFRVMSVPLKEGRFFDERDRAGSEPVAIVNEALVAKYFPNGDPIGRHIRQFEGVKEKRPWLRIVGVAGNEKRRADANEMIWTDTPVIYLPWRQNSQPSAVLLFRMPGARLPAASLIQQATGDPNVSVSDLDTMDHEVSKVLAYPRFRAVVLAAFAALALVLAVGGLYGVLSRLVARRTHEIGIRTALGASPLHVVTMIAKHGMQLTAIGIILGLASVWGLTRLMQTLLYGVSTMDWANLVVVTLVLLVSAGLATLRPVLRAIRVDPMVALRDE